MDGLSKQVPVSNIQYFLEHRGKFEPLTLAKRLLEVTLQAKKIGRRVDSVGNKVCLFSLVFRFFSPGGRNNLTVDNTGKAFVLGDFLPVLLLDKVDPELLYKLSQDQTDSTLAETVVCSLVKHGNLTIYLPVQNRFDKVKFEFKSRGFATNLYKVRQDRFLPFLERNVLKMV